MSTGDFLRLCREVELLRTEIQEIKAALRGREEKPVAALLQAPAQPVEEKVVDKRTKAWRDRVGA